MASTVGKVNEKEIRAAGAKLDEDMGKHKDTTRSHVKQMTKIYKSMEESNNEQIDTSRATVEKQEAEKKKLQQEIAKL